MTLVPRVNPNSEIVSLGDANFNALNWDEDNFEFKEMVDRPSFQIINENTRIGKNKDASSCIDHCYTDVPEKIVKAKVVGVGSSEHLSRN